MTLDKKGCHEFRHAFQFLRVWENLYLENYGELEALSHLSNPDDPPDVIAHFARKDIAIEITTVDPPHVRQSEALHNTVGDGCGRSEVPLSIIPRNKQEALKMMYLPEYAPWEKVGDRNHVWYTSIIQTVAKKFTKKTILSISPGIILLPGGMDGSFGEVHVVECAFSVIREHIPAAKDWTLAIFHQWNSLHYFSAVDVPRIGFSCKQCQ